MSCCKCKSNNFSLSQEIVWRDPDGNEYCVFHAPTDKKRVDKETFEAILNTKIEECIKNKLSCDFSEAIFPYDFKLRGRGEKISFQSLFFSQTIFEGNVFISRINVVGSIDFLNSRFEKDVSFQNVDINGSFECEDVEIKGNLYLRNFNCLDVFESSGSTVSGRVFILNSKFKGETDFSFSVFDGVVTFDRSLFYKTAGFFSARFNDTLKITASEFFEEVSFRETIFKGETVFDGDCFKEGVNMYCASFYQKASIHRCSMMHNGLFFRKVNVVLQLVISCMSLENSDFLLTNVEKIDFINVRWRLDADGSRHVVQAENDIKDIECPVSDDDFATNKDMLLTVGDFYRQMKKKYRNYQNDFEASLWHCAENEVVLKELRMSNANNFYRFSLEIYKFSSSYGEDPHKAFVLLTYLLATLFVVLSFGGLQYIGGPPYNITSERVWKLIHVYFQYALFMRPDWSPGGIFYIIALILARLVVPIQAAVFAFALRNKLHK